MPSDLRSCDCVLKCQGQFCECACHEIPRIAEMDQVNAQLNHLVRLVREHVTDCPSTGFCVGGAALDMLEQLECDDIAMLLGAATIRLAKP